MAAPLAGSHRSSGPIYLIKGVRVRSDAADLQAHLKAAYEAGARAVRPRCLCVPDGAEMYVSKVGERFLIKRMPISGRDHHFACSAYEPPAELSGLGQVMGTAITEDPVEDTTILKLDFALSRVGRRAPVESDAEPADSVKTAGSKLSLRGLLHYLWHQAEFNRWTPNMEGRRNWRVLRYHLLEASDRKEVKGSRLREALYIPEVWNPEISQEISKRRRAIFLRKASSKGRRELLLLLGEVEDFEQGRYDYRLKVRNAPDCHFIVPDDLAKALAKRFANELALFAEAKAAEGSQDPKDPRRGHLVVFATFCVDLAGSAHVEELTLMFVNRNWIPVEDAFEIELLEEVMEGHRATKGLRINMPQSRPMACAVLQDIDTGPVALYIVRHGAGETYERLLEELIQHSALEAWIWRPGDTGMPALPRRWSGGPKVGRAPAASPPPLNARSEKVDS